MLNSIIQTVFTWNFLSVVVRLATPIFFAAIGAYIASSSGMGNIAIESIMTFGALAGVLGSHFSGNPWVGVACGFLVGILTALLIAVFSMKLGADPFLVGVALNTFADSLAIFVLFEITGDKGTSASLTTPTFGTIDIPFIKDIPVLGNILSGHHVLTYVCWVILIVLFIVVFKTPLGMRIRACGLNADAAETAGINVKKMQVLALALSGFFAALGGVYLSLNYLHIFSKSMVAGQGWMGIAANGIAQGSYPMLLISSVIFAIFRGLSTVFSTSSLFPVDLVGAVPYIAVFVFVTAASIVDYSRKKSGHDKK